MDSWRRYSHLALWQIWLVAFAAFALISPAAALLGGDTRDWTATTLGPALLIATSVTIGAAFARARD